MLKNVAYSLATAENHTDALNFLSQLFDIIVNSV